MHLVLQGCTAVGTHPSRSGPSTASSFHVGSESGWELVTSQSVFGVLDRKQQEGSRWGFWVEARESRFLIRPHPPLPTDCSVSYDLLLQYLNSIKGGKCSGIFFRKKTVLILVNVFTTKQQQNFLHLSIHKRDPESKFYLFACGRTFSFFASVATVVGRSRREVHSPRRGPRVTGVCPWRTTKSSAGPCPPFPPFQFNKHVNQNDTDPTILTIRLSRNK